MIQPHWGYSLHQHSWRLKLRMSNQPANSSSLKLFWWPSWDTKETAQSFSKDDAGVMGDIFPTVLLVRNVTQSFPEWCALTVAMLSGRSVVCKEGSHTVKEAACISWNEVRRPLRVCQRYLQLWSASDPISYSKQVLSNRQKELRREEEIASNPRVLV